MDNIELDFNKILNYIKNNLNIKIKDFNIFEKDDEIYLDSIDENNINHKIKLSDKIIEEIKNENNKNN